MHKCLSPVQDILGTRQPTEWNDTVNGMIYEYLDTNHIAGYHIVPDCVTYKMKSFARG